MNRTSCTLFVSIVHCKGTMTACLLCLFAARHVLHVLFVHSHTLLHVPDDVRFGVPVLLQFNVTHEWRLLLQYIATGAILTVVLNDCS